MATVTGYSKAQILLHWVTALLVAGQFLFHDGIEAAFREGLRAGSMTITTAAALHMGAGMLVLGFTIYRFFLRSERGTPPPPEGEPPWAGFAARLAHLAIYALLFVIPVAGAVAWAQGARGASEVHEIAAQTLFVLVLAHIGAVIVHQFVWKTGLISRMTRPSD